MNRDDTRLLYKVTHEAGHLNTNDATCAMEKGWLAKKAARSRVRSTSTHPHSSSYNDVQAAPDRRPGTPLLHVGYDLFSDIRAGYTALDHTLARI